MILIYLYSMIRMRLSV